MSLRATSQVQCLSSQVKPAAIRKWNDEMDQWFMSAHIGATPSQAPHLKEVLVAGPCTDLPFWWGHGKGRR